MDTMQISLAGFRFFYPVLALLFTFFFDSVPLNAQQIEVSESTCSIRDNSVRGFQVCLELDAKTVESELARFVRSMGKFEKTDRSTWAGMNQVSPIISSDAIDLFAKMTVSSRCIQVFMGAFRSGTTASLSDESNVNLKKVLYDFALECYRSDLKKQIAEAERVVNLAVKAHDKRIRESDELKNKLSRNRREKANLIDDLDRNAKNLEKLLADSTRNVSEKETALEEIRKVRQIAEERKQKLGSVK